MVQIRGIGTTFNDAGDLTENGTTYRAIYKPIDEAGVPPSWVRHPWKSGSQTWRSPADAGYGGIGFELDPSGDAGGLIYPSNDKVNIFLAHSNMTKDAGIYGTPEEIWMGFNIKFSKLNFQQPHVNLVLAQWWQGLAGSPPVVLIAKANGGFTCEVQVRNNATGGNPGATIPPTNIIPLGTCPNDDQWHPFLIHITSGWNGNGLVEAWLDNLTVAKGSYSGSVGYPPGQCATVNGVPRTCNNGNVANSTLDTHFGPYRPSDHAKEQMFFANIKFGPTRASADPTTP
jgi:hypothetical protein